MAGPTEFRRQFPVLERTVHLASCTLGARSVALDAAVGRMLDAMTAGAGAWHDYEHEVDGARRRFAALIGARPDEVALVPNASIGAYQVVSTLGLTTRRRVVTTTGEFPSVAHVLLAQRARGADVVFADDAAAAHGAPAGDGDGPTGGDAAGHYERCVDDRTALVSVPLVTYDLGAVLPVAEVAELAHDRGARVLVDAYQAVGVRPVDVAALGCDYLVAGAQKYLLGLPGLGFLYAKGGAAGDHDPVLTGWFGRKDPFAFDPRLVDFPATARRFETGTWPVPSVYGANAGMDLLAGVDLEAVRRHVAGLVSLVVDRLTAQGERFVVPRGLAAQGAHVGLVDRDPAALAAWLWQERRISVSPRGAVARVSFHFYNDADDVEALCAAVRDYRSLGTSTPQLAGERGANGRVDLLAR